MGRIIGITGPIASGKSTVSSILSQHIADTLVLDADAMVHYLYETDTQLAAQMSASLENPALLSKKGGINRQALAHHIKQKPEDLVHVEGCVHPRFHQLVQSEIASSHENTTLILDVPLLLTSPLKQWCDVIVYCDCPEDIRKERLKQRDNIEAALVDTLIKKQKEKIEAHRSEADIFIDTTKQVDTLQAQLTELFHP